jgi:hypothetical protein
VKCEVCGQIVVATALFSFWVDRFKAASRMHPLLRNDVLDG